MNEKKITFEMFDTYRKDYSGGSEDNFIPYDKWKFKPWEDNKTLLKNLLRGELILTKDIVFEQRFSDMYGKMIEMIRQYRSFFEHIFSNLLTELNIKATSELYALWLFERDEEGEIAHEEERETAKNYGIARMFRMIFDSGEYFYYNSIPFDSYNSYVHTYDFKYEHKITLNLRGKKVVIQDNQKLMKMLAQVCQIFDMSEEFEKFRITQSQMTNLRNIHGKLNLSIHPLDFATASDNENGWHSCMSWQNSGCYRLGTTEMMNSPYVLCAYISSDSTCMTIDGQKWPSKKWRAWVIVTPAYIFVNRHYPYHDDKIAIEILNWVRELAEEAFGWKYEEPSLNFVDLWYNRSREENWDTNIKISTNYMYNDIGGDDIVGCMSIIPEYYPKNNPDYEYYRLNISGPAQCMCCGTYIEPGISTEDTLLCEDCDQTNVVAYCSRCGDPILESDYDEAHIWEDGDVWCRDCMDQYADND